MENIQQISTKVDVKSKSRLERAIYVFVLGMLTAFGPVCTDLYLPALPIIATDLNASSQLIGLSLTSCFFGLALGQLFIGPISDSYGRKKPLVISLIVFTLASVLCSITQDPTHLVIYRFFQGFCGAGGLVLSRSIACDMYHGFELTQFMALLMAINSVAPIIGPIVGSFVITFASWHTLFYILALWGVLLCVLCIFKVDETLPKDKRQDSLMSSVVGMLKELLNIKFLLLSLSMGFIMGGFFAYLAASPFVFQSIYGYSAVIYSVIFGINAIAISLTATIAGRLTRRVGDSRLVVFSLYVLMITSLCMLAIAILKPESSIYVLVVLCINVAMIGSSQTPGFGIVMSAKKGGAGAASGIFGVITFVFAALSSSLVGVMGEQSMIPLAVLMIIGAFVSYILFSVARALKG